MNELLAKLTSYNLFNYLLPGAVFVVLAEQFTDYSLRQDDLFLAFFVYYFIGLVISRVGSVVIEPTLKAVGFVTFAPYDAFVRRSREDNKLETLSEANNMYRTLLSAMVCLGALKLFGQVTSDTRVSPAAGPWVLWVFLTGLFLLAYRKQTGYVRDRVNVE